MHIFSKCVRFMGESAGYWPEMAHWKAFLLALSCTRASWGAYYMCLLFSLDFLEVSNGEKFTCAHLMDSVAFVRGYLRFARFSTLSRCSKLFYTFSRCYFHIESAFSGASISFVLSHIARYAPSPEENSCARERTFNVKLISNTYLMSANEPLMVVNVFLCGLWRAMFVNGSTTA